MTHALPEHTLILLSDFIDENLALHFSRDRWDVLERNISAAAKEFGKKDVESFIQHIVTAPMTVEAVEILTSHLTVNETYFWREPGTFDALEQTILPELIRSREKEKRIRIWSAGCSTGEEAYSIAIALHRAIPRPEDWNISILATDISPRNLRSAAAGVYDQWSFRNSPEWLKKQYFTPSGKDNYTISPEITKMVKFEYLNLADNIYPSLLSDTNAMDIIFCRNVLIYFTAKRCAHVVHGFFNALVQDGFLIVSASELSLRSLSEFSAVNFPEIVLYQKRSTKPIIQQQTHTVPPVARSLEYSLQPDPAIIIQESQPLFFQSVNTIAPVDEDVAQYPSLYNNTKTSYLQGNDPNVIEKLQKEEQSSDEWILIIRSFANQGMFKEALNVSETAIAEDKLNPKLHYLHAIILLEFHQLSEAIVSLKRAIYLEPNFVIAYYSLGKIYQQLGNSKSAKKCTENVLTILKTCDQDEILFESEGLTAGRFKEIMNAASIS